MHQFTQLLYQTFSLCFTCLTSHLCALQLYLLDVSFPTCAVHHYPSVIIQKPLLNISPGDVERLPLLTLKNEHHALRTKLKLSDMSHRLVTTISSWCWFYISC